MRRRVRRGKYRWFFKDFYAELNIRVQWVRGSRVREMIQTSEGIELVLYKLEQTI